MPMNTKDPTAEMMAISRVSNAFFRAEYPEAEDSTTVNQQ